MKIIAIIPARGGSKKVPRKNIEKLDGVPLIGYTINAAKESECFSEIIVSTDDNEIAEISKELGVHVPFIRPANLADDEAQSAPVVEHAVKFMENLRSIKYDAVIMLQPTSPLRTSTHIKEAINLFLSHECDSVVSVVSVGGNHPFRMKRLIGDQLVNYIDQGFWDLRPRQVLPSVYIRNGAIYLISRDIIVNRHQLIGKKCLGYLMNETESVNIDTSIDLKLAELLIKEKKCL